MRGRLVLLEGLGFRANAHQSEQIALQLQGMAHGDWLIVYYLAQSMDKTNFYNFLVQVIMVHGEPAVRTLIRSSRSISSSIPSLCTETIHSPYMVVP